MSIYTQTFHVYCIRHHGPGRTTIWYFVSNLLCIVVRRRLRRVSLRVLDDRGRLGDIFRVRLGLPLPVGVPPPLPEVLGFGAVRREQAEGGGGRIGGW